MKASTHRQSLEWFRHDESRRKTVEIAHSVARVFGRFIWVAVVVSACSGCGLFYADPDPDTSETEPKPSVHLTVYSVLLVSTGEEIASGCVVNNSIVENDDVIAFKVPKDKEYRVDIRESSFYGSALTEEAQRQACERHDGTPRDWFDDARCLFSTSDSHALVNAEILDKDFNVVSTDDVALGSAIDGAAIRLYMVSAESRRTVIMFGNSTCGGCCVTQYKFDIEVY